MKSRRYLVTGARSGIGRYLASRLDAVALTRDNAETCLTESPPKPYTAIIHCAFNKASTVEYSGLGKYVEDNLLLTESLLNVPHEKFIYFSSVDVYPKTTPTLPRKETHPLTFPTANGIYADLKLMNEALIRGRSPNSLILRPTSLVGPYAQKNTLRRILEEASPSLTLTEDSELNFVQYSDVLSIIESALKTGTEGIFNVASSTNITVREIAEFFNKEVKYGSFHYTVGNIPNTKIRSLYPSLDRTSKQTLDLYTANSEDEEAA